ADGSCVRWRRTPGLRWDKVEQVATSAINQICLMPGDQLSYLCCCADGSVGVFDFVGTRRTFQITAQPVMGVAPLPDGQHAVAACGDGTLKLCDLRSGAIVRDTEVKSDPPSAIAITPDGARAIWGSVAGAMSAWPIDATVKWPLPKGRSRLTLAYLAGLDQPELWPGLETFDEATLSGIGAQLSLAPETDVLEYLAAKYPGVEPPALWMAWMQLQPDRLGKTRQ